MSPKLIRHQTWNITKTEMSPKLKCHQIWNFTQTEVHQNWIITKTEVSSKLKCYQNWNVSKHYNVHKNKNKNSRDRHWISLSCWCLWLGQTIFTESALSCSLKQIQLASLSISVHFDICATIRISREIQCLLYAG